MGTGRFLEKLVRYADCAIETYGLDLSARMIDMARERLPHLVAAVDDAANLDICFPGQTFDLIATHFVTGFVPIDVLAPKIHDKLSAGGYWSFIGGTKAGFPALQRLANGRRLKWLFRDKKLAVDALVSNPADRAEVIHAMESHGFVIRQCQTFKPKLYFANFKEFLDFAYWGGWLTPFVEALGLHKAPPVVRLLINALAFPVQDQHCIEVVLAQRRNSLKEIVDANSHYRGGVPAQD